MMGLYILRELNMMNIQNLFAPPLISFPLFRCSLYLE